MVFILGSILSFIFLFLSGIHFYWASGGKWGIDSAIPTTGESIKAFKPPVIATIIVGMGLLSFALFYMTRIEVFSTKLPSWLISYAGWILPSLFLLRTIGDFKHVGLFKKIKSTKFAKADSKYFIPLCAFLAIAGFLVQIY